MKETGIIMSGDHPKLILDGLKTMTRRVITASNSTVLGYVVSKNNLLWTGLVWDDRVYKDKGPHILHPSTSEYLHVPWVNPDDSDDNRVFRVRCRYDVGDRLWVKETWAAEKRLDHSPSELGNAADVALWYKADNNQRSLLERGKWRPSRFMPRWASRILLEITEVRVERLQEISGQDIKAEGLDVQFTIPGAFDALERFSVLWDSLNAQRGYGWNKNNWVWPISFKRLENAN